MTAEKVLDLFSGVPENVPDLFSGLRSSLATAWNVRANTPRSSVQDSIFRFVDLAS